MELSLIQRKLFLSSINIGSDAWFIWLIQNITISNMRDITQAILTPLIALIAVYIAYQQYDTNRQKLRLDLYNKRFEVFLGLQNLLLYIGQHADVNSEALYNFEVTTSQSVFIFDKDVSDYLQKVAKKARNLRYQNFKIDSDSPFLPVGEERDKLCEENKDLLLEFMQEFKISEQIFAKSLKIKV
jgi:hypothetical protein